MYNRASSAAPVSAPANRCKPRLKPKPKAERPKCPADCMEEERRRRYERLKACAPAGFHEVGYRLLNRFYRLTGQQLTRITGGSWRLGPPLFCSRPPLKLGLKGSSFVLAFCYSVCNNYYAIYFCILTAWQATNCVRIAGAVAKERYSGVFRISERRDNLPFVFTHFRLGNDLYCVAWGAKLYSINSLRSHPLPHSLPLRSSPLNPVWSSGKLCELLSRAWRLCEPSRDRIWCINCCLKLWHPVATILTILQRIDWPVARSVKTKLLIKVSRV